MANYATLISAIQDVIKQNGNNEITGDILQQALLSMIMELGAEFQFGGSAEPTDNPGLPDFDVAYIAAMPGTYTNFGGITLADGEVAILKWTGSWSKETTGIATAASVVSLSKQLGYYICTSGATTAEKSVSAPGYTLAVGGSLKIKFTKSNAAENPTLKIDGAAAMPLYYNGAPASGANCWLADEIVEVFFDGTNYQAYKIIGVTEDGVFNVSMFNAVNGVPAEYVSLADALGEGGNNNIPSIYRKGGMGIKFILSGKWVYYRLMTTNFNKTESNWQSFRQYPVPGSQDLFTCGGAATHGGAVNVSAIYPTSGVDGGNTYTLPGALSVLSPNMRVGGMSIKFIDSVSGKYVVWQFLLNTFSESEFLSAGNWQNMNTDTFAAERVDIVELSEPHKRINYLGELISEEAYTAFRLDVSNKERIKVVFSGNITNNNRVYAFYSTSVESQFGSGTLVEVGPKYSGPYDMDVVVPAGAVTLVICGVPPYNPTVYEYVPAIPLFTREIESINENYANIKGMSIFVDTSSDKVCIGKKYDGANDLLIHFQPCMFNKLMTFYHVGLSPNPADAPLSNPERGIVQNLNRTGSDNIGPINMAGGTVGGNHSYNNDGVTKTAKTDSYEVYVDGILRENFRGFCECVVIKVNNTIFDPAVAVIVDNMLTEPIVKETIIYRIEDGDISVLCSHEYLKNKVVNFYAGMQSVSIVATHGMTPNGAYPDWTAWADVASFTKGSHPDCCCFIEKNLVGTQLVWMDRGFGIGDLSYLGSGDSIFHRNTGKAYLPVISNSTMPAGTILSWRGVYSWNKLVYETANYINFKIRKWAKRFYYLSTKSAYSGYVYVQPYDISKINATNIIEDALGVKVSAPEAKEIVLPITE